jgi:hypothetical protein
MFSVSKINRPHFIYILLVLFFLPWHELKSQNSNYSLIIVHIDPSSRSELRQKIYSYHFLNGHFTGREELLSVKGRDNGRDYMRLDLGNNVLHKNRYLISSMGYIIDLKEKKVLNDQRANLVKCSGDSAIFYTNDAAKGKYYTVYNFKTNQYGEVKSFTFKAMSGQDVEFDKSQPPFKLYLYPQNKPKVLLSDNAGHGQSIPNESRKPDPAIWWLDNSNLIYTQFNKDNTEVSFVKINVNSRATSVIGKGPIKMQMEPGSFTKLSNTEALFNFGDKKFLVDAGKSTVTELQFTKPENGFSAECKQNSYGHILKLNDKEIGKYHFQLKTLKTEKDIAAIVKELVVGTESYQQGLAVWNNDRQVWESVDAEDVASIVGWIKE